MAAAAAKLYGLGVTGVPRVGWFAQPWVQLAAAEWEAVLGTWLLVGAYPVCGWAAALLTFVGFAAVSGYLGWTGVSSCGCFGVIEASPWWAFGIDLVSVTALSTSRPPATPRTAPRALVVTAGLSVALLAAAGVTGSAVWGSPSAALSNLRGEPIAVDPLHLDLGTAGPGARLRSHVEVKNWSPEPVRIIGGTSDCSCVTHDDLPVIVPPGESRRVAVEMRVPRAGAGRLTKRAALYTDNALQPTVQLTVSCLVE